MIDYHKEIPMLRQKGTESEPSSIHLFHCGISPITQRAADAMDLYNREVQSDPVANFPSRLDAVNNARENAARLLGTEPQNIAFTKSTTHGLLLMAHSIQWKPGDVIVVEKRTFPANWYVWKDIEERFQIKVLQWSEKDWKSDPQDLENILKEHPVRLVSVSAADYATGYVHDLESIGKLVKSYGAIFGVDGIQAAGCIPVDVKKSQIDFLSADGHKWLLAPEGAGILYVNPDLIPHLSGAFAGWIGRDNFTNYESRTLPPAGTARRFEEGALNFAGIVALGGSLDLINEIGIDEVWNRTWKLRELIRAWGVEKGWSCVSSSDRLHSNGAVNFMIAGDPDLKGDGDPSAPDNYVESARSVGVYLSQRRGFLRFAPHFYQSQELVQEALVRLDSIQAETGRSSRSTR